MKKLLHNELQEAAVALREGNTSPEIFFGKLVTLLRDHFDNLGLSAAAFRYWTYDRSPELRRSVKNEFSMPGVNEGLIKAYHWLENAANTSCAFTLQRAKSKDLPLFRSIMWRYYFRQLDPAAKDTVTIDSDDPVFYEPPPQDARSPIIRRPWV